MVPTPQLGGPLRSPGATGDLSGAPTRPLVYGHPGDPGHSRSSVVGSSPQTSPGAGG